MDGFEERQRYWEASRRVRETFARYELSDMLHRAFTLADEMLRAPSDQLENFQWSLAENLAGVEPAFEPAVKHWRALPVARLRGELAAAFAKIRLLAQDVAAGEASATIPVMAQLSLLAPNADHEGRPRQHLVLPLADALVWVAWKLFAEVPRSLIRPCGLAGCSTIYVGTKNQKHCATHQIEARRQTQRRAERAFRARQRAKTRRKSR